MDETKEFQEFSFRQNWQVEFSKDGKVFKELIL